jgi:5'-phosphate synthase pdxT subunit
LGVESRLVKLPSELKGVTHLVIPGGESTAISLLLHSSDLLEPVAEFAAGGGALFGTCAGMIILASEIIDGRFDQVALGAIDITVRRNGFGRQVNSFEADLVVHGVSGGPMTVAFIRAPVVTRVGPDVSVLASVRYEFPDGGTREAPAVCRSKNVLVSSFHPEVTGDDRLHKLFLESF